MISYGKRIGQSRPPRRRSSAQGFSLIEIGMVLVIIAFLLTMVAVPLSTQVNIRRAEETKKLLEQAKDALLGFATANGRFPCPARFVSTANQSQGLESFCAAVASGTCVGTETTTDPSGYGNCSNFYNGFLPAATLGLSPLDAQGFLRDGWGTELSRIRYSVFGGSVSTVLHPFTVANGMQSATLANLGGPDYLFICASGTGTTATTCGPASNALTSKAPIVLLSLGANAPTPSASGDEPLNVDGNVVFVSHEETGAGTATAFDDIVTWISINTILSRMVAAGRLP